MKVWGNFVAASDIDDRGNLLTLFASQQETEKSPVDTRLVAACAFANSYLLILSCR